MQILTLALYLTIAILLVKNAASYAVGQSKYGIVEEFPYQVMLIGKQLWGKPVLCGGTLLDRRWILTAGHCLTGVTHFDVHLGARSVNDTLESGRIMLRSNKFILHERFNPFTAANDIALVKLPKDILFTSRIQPAVLPKSYRGEKFIGNQVVATGWRAVGKASNSDLLQVTELFVIPNEECAEEYDVITHGVMCAKGFQGETVCSGDSGGPLVLKGTQIVVGITSFGPTKGCKPNIPGGFTRVTSYLNWIESKIGSVQRRTANTNAHPQAQQYLIIYDNGRYHRQQHQRSHQYQQQYRHMSRDNENIV